YATWGLLIFVAVFVGTTLWILTRSRRQVSQWSNMPLEDSDRPPTDQELTDRRAAAASSHQH
ncbi:MAG: cbb3-type cytochrome c oxidase subunit 3, partial [Algisphaera sp.]